MATVERLIERIETRLALVSGLDVQIHAEDRIAEFLRHRYITLSEKLWLPQFQLVVTTTWDGVTGAPVADLSTTVRKYSNIKFVYIDTNSMPLHQLKVTTNPLHVRRICYGPTGVETSILKVYPPSTTGPVAIVYRPSYDDNLWETADYSQELPWDEEALMCAVIFDFLVDDGSNPEATAEYKRKYMERMDQLKKAVMDSGIDKYDQNWASVPDEWQEWPG